MKCVPILIVGIIVVVLGSSRVRAEYAPPLEGLVGWWRGDGDGVDSAGTNDGQVIAGFETGKFDQAFSFAPGVNRVFVGERPEFELTNSITIGAWVKPTAVGWTILMRAAPVDIAYSLDANFGAGYRFFVQGEDGVSEEVRSPNPVAFGQWQHVVGTLDGASGRMRLYIDGEVMAEKLTGVRAQGKVNPDAPRGLVIGNEPRGGFPFVGLVDEVVLYSRALSADEVGVLMGGTSNSPPKVVSQPQGITGYWGKSATLLVKVSGAEPLSYLWYKDGFPIPWGTNATFTLNDLQLSDAGDYQVVVTNRLGSVTSEKAWLAVNPAGVSLGMHPSITIDGVVGKTYGIQYVTSVTHTNEWSTLTTIQLTQPTQLWVDTNCNVYSGDNPRRFYRVIAVP